MPAHSRNKYSVSIPDRVVVAICPARAGVRHRTAKSSYGKQRAGARSRDIYKKYYDVKLGISTYLYIHIMLKPVLKQESLTQISRVNNDEAYVKVEVNNGEAYVKVEVNNDEAYVKIEVNNDEAYVKVEVNNDEAYGKVEVNNDGAYVKVEVPYTNVLCE